MAKAKSPFADGRGSKPKPGLAIFESGKSSAGKRPAVKKPAKKKPVMTDIRGALGITQGTKDADPNSKLRIRKRRGM